MTFSILKSNHQLASYNSIHLNTNSLLDIIVVNYSTFKF